MALNIPGTFDSVLTNIITAVIILLLGFVAGKIAGMILTRTLAALSVDDYFKKLKRKRVSVVRGVSSFISLCLYVIAVILVLRQLGLTSMVLRALLITLIALVLVAIVFAVIELLVNAFIRLELAGRNSIRKGDRLKSGKIEGTVERVAFSFTKLRTDEGETYVLPNRLLARKKFSVEKKQAGKK
jgi:small-conductance mechanosensitive channel